MYHRFEENKYPSTNIKLADFRRQIKLIENENINFVNPNNLTKNLFSKKKERKILLTIDDGFLSFYNNAWPILKKKEFHLFCLSIQEKLDLPTI